MHESSLYLTLQEWEDLLKLNQPVQDEEFKNDIVPVLEEYGL